MIPPPDAASRAFALAPALKAHLPQLLRPAQLVQPVSAGLRERVLLARSRLSRDHWRDPDLMWLFILAFPNGGSTALLRILETASVAMTLTGMGEGQRLVRAMYRKGKRWDPNYHLNYGVVRAVWLEKARQRERDGPRVVIEKSPPSMVRINEILRTFSDMPTKVIELTRDPYATVERWSRRRTAALEAAAGIRPSSSQRMRLFEHLGDLWGQRAEMLVAAENVAFLRISYEDLCRDPDTTLAPLVTRIPLLSDIDPSNPIQVKRYRPQTLRDMNDESFGRLTPEDLSAITMGLSRHGAAVQALGYTIRA